MRRLASALASVLGATVGWMVVGLLAVVTFLAFLQLMLRWFAGTALPGVDEMVRKAVLWVAMLGGILAAGEGRHIKVDLVEHYVRGRTKREIGRALSLVSALGCFGLSYISIRFLQVEYRSILVGMMPVWVWVSNLVIPFGFFLMGVNFLLQVYLAKLPSSESR